jgi:hypothetical protein
MIPTIIDVSFNAQVNISSVSADFSTSSDDDSSWIPTGVNEPLTWSLQNVTLFEDGCPMAAPEQEEEQEEQEEQPSIQTDPFWLSRPCRRICALCDGNCECEVEQTPPLHTCAECNASYHCHLWDPIHGCCADCADFPECAVCCFLSMAESFDNGEEQEEPQANVYDEREGWVSVPAAVHTCMTCNEVFECPAFEYATGCDCLPTTAQCDSCEGKETMACWGNGTLTVVKTESIPTKVDLTATSVCMFCGTVWKDWKFILNPNYCECEMRKDMFAEIEASWEPTASVPTPTPMAADKTCKCLLGEECNSCAPRMSFPCLSCNIPIFCGAPMICSDCV